MERGQKGQIGLKLFNICLRKNPSMGMKDIDDLSNIPNSHQFSMFGFFPAAK